MSNNPLIIRDREVGEDAFGYLNLTDIWRIAGSPSTKTTSNWRQLPTTDEYIQAVAQNLGKSYVKGKNDKKSVLYTKAGKGGGTFAHVLVALAYGEYLSPALAVEIKTTYQRARTGDLTLVDEILAKADAARHHNEVRDLSKEVRKKYTDALASHEAKSAIGYCTDAIYEVLLGGTARQLIVSRNLPAKANVREALPTGELLQTMNTEYLSAERIEGLNIRGREPCAEASRQVARHVKKVFAEVREDKPLDGGK
ncbi:MAG: KilA-N domain-containing protein [Hyphomicrobium sp.]|nr:KilA-N domain-containing protein [Hyphomicrobium sp.]